MKGKNLRTTGAKGFYLLLALAAYTQIATAQNLTTEQKEASKLIDNQKFKEARASLGTLLEAKPKDAVLNYLMGKSFLEEAKQEEDGKERAEELAKAQGFFAKGIERSSRSAINQVGMGEYFALTANPTPNGTKKTTPDANLLKQSGSYLRKAVELQPEDVYVLSSVASGYLEMGVEDSVDKATFYLAKAQALDPKNPKLIVLLGDTYYQRNVEELPLSKYQEAIALDPNLVEAYYKTGLYYLRYRKLLDAIKVLGQAKEKDPQFAPAYQALGEAFGKNKQYPEAKEFYRKYVELRGDDISARYRFAQFLYLSKKYDEAVVEINTVLSKQESNVMLRLLAYSNFELGKVDEAKSALDKYFQKIDPKNIIAKDYEYKGKIEIAQGQVDAGLADIYKCIELDQTRTDLYDELVKTFTIKADYAHAIEVQKRSTATTPGVKNYFALGRLYEYNKQYKNADTVLRKLVEFKADFLLGYLDLGRVNAKIDSNTTQGLAKPFYEKVEQLAKGDTIKYRKEMIEAYSYLMYFYYNVEPKNNKVALDYCEKLLALDPTNKQGVQLKPYLLQLIKAGK